MQQSSQSYSPKMKKPGQKSPILSNPGGVLTKVINDILPGNSESLLEMIRKDKFNDDFKEESGDSDESQTQTQTQLQKNQIRFSGFDTNTLVYQHYIDNNKILKIEDFNLMQTVGK